MKKKAITLTFLVLVAILATTLTVGYFGVRYTLDCKSKLDKEEVQWALEHPEQVKATMESYKSVHKAADEVYFGILEQGKE